MSEKCRIEREREKRPRGRKYGRLHTRRHEDWYKPSRARTHTATTCSLREEEEEEEEEEYRKRCTMCIPIRIFRETSVRYVAPEDWLGEILRALFLRMHATFALNRSHRKLLKNSWREIEWSNFFSCRSIFLYPISSSSFFLNRSQFSESRR